VADVADEIEWKEVFRSDGKGQKPERTFRARVPRGWLFRHVTPQPGGVGIVESMVFVPDDADGEELAHG
jgi:hypothetical protein